jgi:hypothetical protein
MLIPKKLFRNKRQRFIPNCEAFKLKNIPKKTNKTLTTYPNVVTVILFTLNKSPIFAQHKNEAYSQNNRSLNGEVGTKE